MSTARGVRGLSDRLRRLEEPEDSDVQETVVLRLPANGRDVATPSSRRSKGVQLTLHHPGRFRAAMAAGVGEAAAWASSVLTPDELAAFNAEVAECE